MKTLNKIVTILAAGLIIWSASKFAYSLPDGIPERFENYKTEANYMGHRNVNIGGMMFHEHRYDIDGDGKQDVSELYVIPYLPEIGFESFSIGYDIDGDGKYRVNEIWIGGKRLDEVADELGLDKSKIPINLI